MCVCVSDVKADSCPAVVGGVNVANLAAQSRSEDEDQAIVKDIKRPAAQTFGGGGLVPKRRSSSRYSLPSFQITTMILGCVMMTMMLSFSIHYVDT